MFPVRQGRVAKEVIDNWPHATWSPNTAEGIFKTCNVHKKKSINSLWQFTNRKLSLELFKNPTVSNYKTSSLPFHLPPTTFVIKARMSGTLCITHSHYHLFPLCILFFFYLVPRSSNHKARAVLLQKDGKVTKRALKNQAKLAGL